MTRQEENHTTESSPDQDRRSAIKKIAVGVGVLAGCSVLPEKWTRPLVGQIALPAHAETSAAIPTDEPAAEFNTSETFTIAYASKSGGKQFTWLPQTGAYYGGSIKFVFGNTCGELYIQDAKVTQGADGNTSNYNQAYYFSGTDFSPGAEEYNAGRASVFAPPNCGANTVTIYYNK